MEIRPQAGRQEQFLASPADICIYGGAAGGGKSFALLLEPLRHISNPGFGAVVFRRTSPELVGAGSLWEESRAVYGALGAKMREHPYLIAEFQSGASVQFTHLQHAKDVYSHQGKQYAFVGFDELTHFLEAQFWYLVSRLRTTCGVKPYMRCTTNPDPDSFVRKLIAWWIGEDGFPIAERSGHLRWFIRKSGEVFWADSKAELQAEHPGCRPLSLTFVPARLEDNPILEKADPDYRAKLDALPMVERARLLDGNWDIRPMGGNYIRRDWFAERWTPETLPEHLRIYDCSDFAVTEATEGNDPDYTEHGRFGVDDSDNLYVLDWWYGQTTPDVWIDVLIDRWATQKPVVWFGEGGVIRHAIEPLLNKRMKERRVYVSTEWVNPTGRTLATPSKEGFADRSKQAKAIRGRAFQARAKMGKIIFPADAPWVDHVLEQCIDFPGPGHDDSFDVMSQMCLVIDEAHPAVVPSQPEPEQRRERWQRVSTATQSWRV